MFVNSDHAGDQHTCRLCSGFVIYLNTALVHWNLKRQSKMKTCTFITEFVIMKTGIETLQGICCKIHMMGIPIDGATHIYGDSMFAINKTSKPESVLKKKCNVVCYHTVCESVAMGESLTNMR
ncbi:hypothetical protein ACHAXS_002265 [Conticribra weissflogii]